MQPHDVPVLQTGDLKERLVEPWETDPFSQRAGEQRSVEGAFGDVKICDFDPGCVHFLPFYGLGCTSKGTAKFCYLYHKDLN